GMPGKNGYEVAEYIRQTPNLSHIPVVLLTGAFEPVDQAKASAAGCDGVLAKPFEPQMVIGRVKELLAKGRGAGGPLDAAAAVAPAAAAPPEGWGSAFDEPIAPAVPKPAAAPAAALDDYFDRLDAAFSSASGGHATVAPPEPTLAPPAPPSPAEIDWFSAAPAEAPAGTQGFWDLPAPAPSAVPDAPVDLPLSVDAPHTDPATIDVQTSARHIEPPSPSAPVAVAAPPSPPPAPAAVVAPP